MEEITKKPVLDEIAVAEKDIDIYAGWINRLENPDPILRTQANGKGLKLYDEVERDGHAGAVLQQRFLPVVSRPWDVIPSDDSDRAKQIADFVKDTLKGANFKQACQEVLLSILYGYYVLEIMWGVKNGKWGISKFRAKHPNRFQFTPARELRMITPQNMLDGEAVPDKKFIVFTYGSSDNPYGKGLGQKMWWSVWFKKNGIKFWMIFLDKFGSPTPVGKYPSGGDKAKGHKKKLLEVIDAIQQETGVAIPDDLAIDLMEATRGGNVTYETLCEYMDKQNTKTVLSQTGTTDIKDAGAYNASQTLDEIRQAILEADADLLCECFNEEQGLIRWIVDYNFAGVEEYPEFTIHTKPSKNSKAHAETDEILINKIGLPVTEKYFYEKYNIPAPEEGEKLLVRPEPAKATASSKEPETDFSEPQAHANVDLADTIDTMADRQAALAMPGISKNIDIIKDHLASARSLKSARKGLVKLYDVLDDTRLGLHLGAGLSQAWDTGINSINAEADFTEVLWGPGTAFESAVEYFEARGFYIGQITNADLLGAVENEIIKAMEGGVTLDAFKEDVDNIFTTHGYDPLAPFHVKTIFQTNLHLNYQGGRYFQMKTPAVVKTRPYWRLIAVRDGNTRPDHWAVHGKIFRHDHPFWDIWYPPNGYNCRCTVTTVSEREMKRYGWDVEKQDPTGLLYEPVNPVTGVRMPGRNLMPDPGWSKNPAKEVWKPDFSKYSPDLAAKLKTALEATHA